MADTNISVVGLRLRERASVAALERAETALNVRLPMDYVAFLKLSDGGEGFIGEAYLDLWSVQDLVIRNRAYEVKRNAPDILLFGSDGGGEAFGFSMRTTPWSVVQIPFIPMDPKYARHLGDSFTDFLKRLEES